MYMGDIYTGNFLANIMYDNGDFYKDFIVKHVNGPHRAEIVTYIRLQLNPYIMPEAVSITTMDTNI